MRRGRKSEKAGAMVIVMVYFAIVISAIMWASIRMGIMGGQMDKWQDSADSIALAANYVAMIDGLQAVCNHPILLALADANRPRSAGLGGVNTCPEPVLVQAEFNGEEVTYLTFAPQLRTHLRFEESHENAPGAWDNPQQVDRIISAGAIFQDEHSEIVLRIPKLVLVLDYSGSMRMDFGQGRSRLQALQAAVSSLLDLDLRVDYGLVMFNDGVIDTENIQEGNEADIESTMQVPAQGGTIYEGALRRAVQMLQQNEDTGYYILFVSDGEPNNGDGPALMAADQARMNDVTIFTLNVGAGEDRRELLTQMSGNKGDPGDPNYYFSAANDNELQRTFQQIVSSILCTAGPLVPVPPDDLEPWDIKVLFSADGADENPLRYANDLANVGDEMAYQYDRAENELRFSEAACNAMERGDGTLMVRFPLSAMGASLIDHSPY